MNHQDYDVVIPAYNAAATVRRALDSVLAQAQPPRAVVVVDDGSSDETAAIVESYGAPVRLIRQANAGPGAARNRGARETSSPWIALLDADDEWLPGKMKAQMALTSDPKVGVVCCPSQGFHPPFPEPCDLAALWRRNPLSLSSAVVRRTAFESVEGFSSDRLLDPVADYDLWLRIVSGGWRFVQVSKPLLRYHTTPGNLSSQTARFAASELALVDRLGLSLGMDPANVAAKRQEILDTYGREALFFRNMPTARALLSRALIARPSAWRVAWFMLSFAPVGLLDLRRRAKARSSTN
ncbi:MAG: glycosyltransferase family A protein [Isosphaeraceae bacterium]